MIVGRTECEGGVVYVVGFLLMLGLIWAVGECNEMSDGRHFDVGFCILDCRFPNHVSAT